MEYSTSAQTQSAQTQRTPMTALAGELRGANAIEQRTLDSLLDRLQKELSGIAENTARIAQFKNRLITPRAQGVGEKAPDTPEPGSVEGRLQYLIQFAHGMGAHLNETANDLDRAA